MRWFVAFILCFVATTIHAGGRGGHVTTFDSNLYGGSWTTINCNGTGSDDTAWAAWKTASVAANPALAKLRVTGSCLISSAIRLNEGIKNSIIWGYGASVSDAFFGGGEFPLNNLLTARIVTASVGDPSVTLVVAADSSKFSVGDWICVTALELQGGGLVGYPPNFNFFEYRLITAITGTTTKVITLNQPLTQNYLSTYPLIDAGGPAAVDQGGPATVYNMGANWGTNYQVFGLSVARTAAGQVNMRGKDGFFYDMSFYHPDGIAPTMGQNLWIVNTGIRSTEVDKDIENLYCVRCVGVQLLVQSSSVNNLVLTNTYFQSIGATVSLLGTAKNTTVNGGFFPIFRVGPTAYGHGVSLSVTGATLNTSQASAILVQISSLSYSAGVFSIARADPTWSDAIRWGVPGQKYFFGASDGTDNSIPHTVFTITGVTDNGVTTSFTTDIAGALPTPSCGIPCSTLVAYPATITQKFSGPADLTQFSTPP